MKLNIVVLATVAIFMGCAPASPNGKAKTDSSPAGAGARSEGQSGKVTLAVGIIKGFDTFISFVPLERNDPSRLDWQAQKVVHAPIKLDSIYVWFDLPPGIADANASLFRMRYRCSGKPGSEWGAGEVSDVVVSNSHGDRTVQAELGGLEHAYAECTFFPVEISFELTNQDGSEIVSSVTFDVRGV